jgi:hypothetical protein
MSDIVAGLYPSNVKLPLQLLPASGSAFDPATAVTPGTRATAASASRANALRASSVRYFALESASLNVTSRCVLNPGLIAVSRTTL